MNIFVLDTDPVKAAAYHCDKHVCKMLVETAQILSTVIQKHDPEAQGFYKPTHKNHPCVLWAGETKENFRWLYHLGRALCEQYTRRYGKTHKSETIIIGALSYYFYIPPGKLEPFVQCMPEDVKDTDPVKAYRQYYITYKSDLLQWKTEIPYWVTN